jgi:hypothetical protein
VYIIFIGSCIATLIQDSFEILPNLRLVTGSYVFPNRVPVPVVGLLGISGEFLMATETASVCQGDVLHPPYFNCSV